MKKIVIKDWEFYVYNWHSINLIPTFSRVSVCDDGENGYKVCACWLSLALFGTTFNIQYPTLKPHRLYTSKVIGPLWSRKKKMWYYTHKKSVS